LLPKKSRTARLIIPYSYILKTAAHCDATNFVVNVAVGSKGDLPAPKCDFRFTPSNGHRRPSR
jgi:hypothetical protein